MLHYIIFNVIFLCLFRFHCPLVMTGLEMGTVVNRDGLGWGCLLWMGTEMIQN